MGRLAALLGFFTSLSSLWAKEPGLLLIYPSHGSPRAVTLTGRFIEDEGFAAPDAHRGGFANLVDNFKRLESDEIEGALVRLTVGGQRFTARTDDDGVFWVKAEALARPLPVGVLPVRGEVLAHRGHPAPPARGLCFVLPRGPHVAVISDFDDTVVRSNVTNKLELLAGALGKNAAQLEPVAGAAEAYRRAADAGAVAFFYLSGSPQSFTVRIQDFLGLQRFPIGPLLLKNFGQDALFGQSDYKLSRLRGVFDAHPETRFVLIGDSGEHDPEIYARMRAERPAQVVGVIIRKAPGGEHDAARFEGMRVVEGFDEDPDLVARMVRAAQAR